MELENLYFEILWMFGVGLPPRSHQFRNPADFPLRLGELLYAASADSELHGDDSAGRVMVGYLV